MTLLELIERAGARLRGSDYDFEKALPYLLASELAKPSDNTTPSHEQEE